MAERVHPCAARLLMLLGRAGLGGVLVYAASLKLWSVTWGEAGLEIQRLSWISFAAAIQAYELLPVGGVIFVAKTLPWFELVLGAWLISGIWLRWAAATASALLGAFFLVMARAYALGMEIDCGCFGPGDTLSAATLARDGALLAVSLALTAAAFRLRRAPRTGDAAEPAAVHEGAS